MTAVFLFADMTQIGKKGRHGRAPELLSAKECRFLEKGRLR
jgi:hypothetical protein